MPYASDGTRAADFFRARSTSQVIVGSMSEPSPSEDPQPGQAVTTSRERAVTRLTRGTAAIYAGGASLFAVLLADVFGLGGIGVQVAQVGSASLIWLGCILMISGVPHLVRFGTRRGILALSSFGAAGVIGLVAVAEMFESFFLDSTVLQGLDRWALAIAVVLVLFGGFLLSLGTAQSGRSDGDL